MKKHLRIIATFFKLSWLTSAEYRINFFVWLFVDIGWAIMDIIFFSTLVSNIGSIGSWSKGEVFFVVGLFRVLSIFVWAWLFQSFSKLPKQISRGDLDIILTKPIDSQFAVSFRYFSINMIASLVIGSIYMAVGSNLSGHHLTLISSLSLFWLCLVSVALIYSMYFFSMTLILFFDRVNNMPHVFPHSYDAARYPSEIYPPLIQRLVTTIWPVALILAVPANSFFQKPDFVMVTLLHSITIIFFLVGRRTWQLGMQRYSSASS